MAWITLQPDDLRKRFAPAELAAFQRAKADLDDSALAAVLTEISGTIRDYVAGNRKNRLAAPPAIPSNLKNDALSMAVVAYSISVAGIVLDPKGARKQAEDRAIKHLEGVAEGKFGVDQPDPVDANQPEARPRPQPSISVPRSILATPSYDLNNRDNTFGTDTSL